MTDAFTARIQYLEQRLHEAEAERYLPLACPNCGRMRLIWRQTDRTASRLTCEKCYMDADGLADIDNHEMLTAAHARIAALEEALRSGIDLVDNPPAGHWMSASSVWLRAARALLSPAPAEEK